MQLVDLLARVEKGPGIIFFLINAALKIDSLYFKLYYANAEICKFQATLVHQTQKNIGKVHTFCSFFNFSFAFCFF